MKKHHHKVKVIVLKPGQKIIVKCSSPLSIELQLENEDEIEHLTVFH